MSPTPTCIVEARTEQLHLRRCAGHLGDKLDDELTVGFGQAHRTGILKIDQRSDRTGGLPPCHQCCLINGVHVADDLSH
jgi:hypothetical protein